MFLRRVFLLAVAVATVPALACSEMVERSGDNIVFRGNTCRSCSVVADSVAYLGHPDDTLAIGSELLPAVDSRGRFYVADAVERTMIAFSPGGRLMTRFGKSGAGPGEFARIRVVVAGPGDTLVILAGNAMHVVSPEYEHMRQYQDPQPGPASFDFTMLRDGRLLRQGSEPNTITLTTLAGDSAGTITLQGVDTTFTCGECGRRVYRESHAGGTIWSGTFNQYAVEEHALDGTFLRRITREAEWFPPWGDEPRGEDELAEFSVFRLVGALQDSTGTLWTHTAGIANVDSLRKVMAQSGTMPTDESQMFQLMVTNVEAIDPDAGELFGRLTLQGLVLPLVRGYAAQLVVDPSGDWAWRILRYRLQR